MGRSESKQENDQYVKSRAVCYIGFGLAKVKADQRSANQGEGKASEV